jgi:serine/threonine protein kinase
LTGQVVDNYQILELLGKGGMGIVYKAMDMNLQSIVALKMMNTQLTKNENFLRRFRSEGISLAKLRHPNIVSVYALRETAIGLLLVMEYVEGTTLARLLGQNGPMPFALASPLFKQFINAVGYAHHQRVIHRDIKPSNVMVTRQGIIKVTDFGLAKNQDRNNTNALSGGGTLEYMSPEQLQGLASADALSDIYSMGITMYEVLAGRTPFETSDSESKIRKKIIDGEIPSPTRLNPNIPKEVAKIIGKAIEKKPAKRFQSTEEMLAAFERLESPRLSMTEMEWRRLSRRHLIMVSAVAAAICILIYLVWLLVPSLLPKTKLSIFSDPAGATVFVNGDSAGITPVTNYSVKKEDRSDEVISLFIKKPGYLTVNSSFGVERGQDTTLAFTLQPAAIFSMKVAPPNATVTIDDKPVNPSRLTNIEFPAGRHPIRIAAEGYKPMSFQIDLPQGRSLLRTYKLEKLSSDVGAIELTSRPSGAVVALDGAIAGKTPYLRSNMPAGRYQLQMRLDGYKDFSKMISIGRGQKRAVSETLLPVGSLRITSQPGGASVFVDGRSVGTTPVTIPDLEIGRHRIVMSKESYGDYSATVDVKHRQTLHVKATLVVRGGALRLLVNPYGDVYIDGKLTQKKVSGQFSKELSANAHRLQVVHPTLGIYEKTVTIKPQKQVYFPIDFNKKFKLTVSSTPVWGEIFVDGRSSGNTPRELALRMGKHVIDVRRAGYVAKPLAVSVENDFTQPLLFTLARQSPRGTN